MTAPPRVPELGGWQGAEAAWRPARAPTAAPTGRQATSLLCARGVAGITELMQVMVQQSVTKTSSPSGTLPCCLSEPRAAGKDSGPLCVTVPFQSSHISALGLQPRTLQLVLMPWERFPREMDDPVKLTELSENICFANRETEAKSTWMSCLGSHSTGAKCRLQDPSSCQHPWGPNCSLYPVLSWPPWGQGGRPRPAQFCALQV